MKTRIGVLGCECSWQAGFEETVKCERCGGEARMMFVAYEGMEEEKRSNSVWVCDIRDNGGEGHYWPHDCIACAVYLCRHCFHSIAILNQA